MIKRPHWLYLTTIALFAIAGCGTAGLSEKGAPLVRVEPDPGNFITSIDGVETSFPGRLLSADVKPGQHKFLKTSCDSQEGTVCPIFRYRFTVRADRLYRIMGDRILVIDPNNQRTVSELTQSSPSSIDFVGPDDTRD